MHLQVGAGEGAGEAQRSGPRSAHGFGWPLGRGVGGGVGAGVGAWLFSQHNSRTAMTNLEQVNHCTRVLGV